MDVRKAPAGTAAAPAWAGDPGCPRMERYLIGPELGRGGMGRVHLAWDPMLKRLVALKVLPGDDPETHLRLFREARAQARLEHPCICRIHDLGEHGGRPFIAMQLVQGRPLGELWPELGPETAAAVLAEVAEAVHAAHRAGLIHRDLKPANILLEGTGPYRPVVVDFGLARDFQALEQTLSWAVLGTPAFMSPEQARGEALGPSTDIYSLGATLYAMLTGQPPHEGATLAGLLAAHQRHGVRPPRRLGAAIPVDLETITLRCLEPRPADRYPTALALADDLRRFLAGKPVQVRPVGPAGRALRWARRQPALAALLAATLLATITLVGWNVRTRRIAARREAAAQRFGLEIRDAEHLLRIERMMPLHDLRPAEARLRARMASIQAEMARLGGAAEGPGRYALGRGHLALRENRQALAALQAAWAAGYRAPEVAHALASAHLDLFQDSAFGLQGGPASPAYRTVEQEHLRPAREWLERAQGARVETATLVEAKLAMALGQFEQAQVLFLRAQDEAPWLYEALLGRASNLVAMLNRLGPGSQRRLDHARYFQQIEAATDLLRQAESIAPSDVAVHVLLSQVWAGRWGYDSARGSRAPAPIQEALAHLEKARMSRPDDEDLVFQHSHLMQQFGFLELSRGGDPAGVSLALAADLTARAARLNRNRKESQIALIMHRHNLAWIAAEADFRFGRDPRPALAIAAESRRAMPFDDPGFGYSLLLEAQDLAGRGGDPLPALAEADRRLRRLLEVQPIQREGFYPWTILGEVHLERARWMARSGSGAPSALAEALACLQRAAACDPKAAYVYYSLPRAHALAARLAMERGQDPGRNVAAALAAARGGLAINPRNAQIQLAAAEAHLATAAASAFAGRDPRPALQRARANLAAADAANPRDYRTCLLRMELELAGARAEPEAAAPWRARAAAAARRGLGIKGDEPRFRSLLAEPPLSLAAAPAASGRPAAGPPGGRP